MMDELTKGERRELIERKVKDAKINWAHVCVGQLMKEGYVGRVLTTNFDSLVMQACSLLQFLPAVYDFGEGGEFKRHFIPEPAVFYLHGQFTGFVLRNTTEECSEHVKALRPVFEEACQDRPCIVVGYSGQNDHIMDCLTAIPEFDYGLHWANYADEEPTKAVREGLLQKGKDAFYMRGHDADDFFVTLAQKLGCFPPAFVAKPFSHLEKCLNTLTRYKHPGQEGDRDVTDTAREWIRRAINTHESEPAEPAGTAAMSTESEEKFVAWAEARLMAGDYESVIKRQEGLPRPLPTRLADTVSWAYVTQGNALSDQAKTKSGPEADGLYVLAGEKYAAALAIKPDKHEALNNWGNALSAQAKTKSGPEADGLYALAGEKYAAALAIKPDMHESLSNWGGLLLSRAGMAEGEVRKVDKEAGKVTLRHGEIRHMDMPPMTMVFQVKDKAMLDNVKVGDKVRFKVVDEGGSMIVTELKGAS